METLWFALASAMVAIYVVMDGFDFGAGVLYRRVARNDRERRQVLAAIGPFWDGNEVWLIAGGGVLFMAFPKVLASALSGFYLAIMPVLWVLILRGISIEFRSHVDDAMWRAFWDATLAMASTLASLLLGVALGNLIRGVPLLEDGWFSLSLFESFSPRGALGLLDWYTVLAGLLALAALAHHGALFLAWKTDGPVRTRSLKAAGVLFPAVVVLWLAATAATASVAPELFPALAARPVAWLATALFLVGLAGTFAARRAGRDFLAFVASGAFLLGILGATAAAVYPTMIRSISEPSRSLTAFNASAGRESLAAGLSWWPAGFALAIVYAVVVFRLHRGKVRAADGEGY
ncbi:MAG TPA: cytochrome d ubiquinol oxidase subunit II [Candidatus Polarisedimenticolia bacterium]|jgi:cytochrome d ubiquinol oxidase subunit II|nr:cytochrome d ubiquinol oxidase subunit II [Candidatus Polarisedimenticolia bacterium]